MSHGLMWLPLLVAFVVLTALGWLERCLGLVWRSVWQRRRCQGARPYLRRAQTRRLGSSVTLVVVVRGGPPGPERPTWLRCGPGPALPRLALAVTVVPGS